MEKKTRLRSDKDFKRVYSKKKKYQNSAFIIYVYKHSRNFYRFGFSVSKKYGKANKRNLIKRRLKYIIDTNKKRIKEGYDFIVIPKYEIIDYDFKRIKDEFLSLLENIKVLRD